MSILVPGFSERVFEFSFNAEYVGRNRAVLAGVPHIPTQNKEKALGYDVQFELRRRGGPNHAVALQHKVSRYVDSFGPRNAHFLSAADGPYFAFRLDVDQFNLLEKLSSAGLPGIEFHFCAPIFASLGDMGTHFMAKSVEGNSIWISVAGAGQIKPDEPHSIIYSQDGTKAFLFSEEPVNLTVLDYEERQVRKTQRENRQDLTVNNVGKVYEAALGEIRNYWLERTKRARAKIRRESTTEVKDYFVLPSSPPVRRDPTVESLAELLSSYVGVSVLVEVAN